MRRAVLLAAIIGGSLVLWVGVPLGWLWLGSQIQAATDSIGAALGAMILGVTVSIIALVAVLGALNRAYQRARVARGLEDTGAFPLETTLVLAAIVAGSAFVVWFFFFSGAQPLPFFGKGT